VDVANVGHEHADRRMLRAEEVTSNLDGTLVAGQCSRVPDKGKIK
jgi:hypothetical protein